MALIYYLLSVSYINLLFLAYIYRSCDLDLLIHELHADMRKTCFVVEAFLKCDPLKT